MNDTRRRFLAFMSGAALTGPIVQQWGISRPALAVPHRRIVLPEDIVPAADLYPLLAMRPTQMEAIADIKATLPDQLFLDWLEGGLRMVEGCKPGGQIWRAMEMDRVERRDPWNAMTSEPGQGGTDRLPPGGDRPA